MKRIVIAGGTGHLGGALVEHFHSEGYNVTVLTRQIPVKGHPGVSYTMWDAVTPGDWISSIDGSDIVINLCGKPVACRYTDRNKQDLIRSRVGPTLLIGEAIQKVANPPLLWINASSSAYYGFSDHSMNEDDSPGQDFPAQICIEWEKAFRSLNTPGTRKVAWRLGVVLQRNRGLILPFVNLVKSFTGGSIGSGKQLFTWIHEDDFLRAAQWTVENTTAEGYFNFTSPEPVTNAIFMSSLRAVMGYNVSISLPSWMVYLGGKLTGVEPSLVLKGRGVLPSRLLQSGFVFQYGKLDHALKELFANENGV